MELRELISFLNLSHFLLQCLVHAISVSFLWTFRTQMCWWSIERVFDAKIFEMYFFLIPFFLFPVLPAQLQVVVTQSLRRRMNSGWRITSSSWKMTGQQWNWQCWSWKASTLIPLVMMLNHVETARGWTWKMQSWCRNSWQWRYFIHNQEGSCSAGNAPESQHVLSHMHGRLW